VCASVTAPESARHPRGIPLEESLSFARFHRMNLRLTAPRCAWLLGVSLGFTVPAARAADWQALTNNSPFGTGAAGSIPASSDQLEFRGVVQEDGIYLVNLFNPTTKMSQWIPVKGKAPGLEVRSYDAAGDKVEVTQGGKALTLPLKQSRVTLVQPTAPAPATAENAEGARERREEGREARDGNRGRSGGNNGEGPPMIRNLPPEAQAMIEEFRRRRAERAGQSGRSNQVQPAIALPTRQP
jgi:hypothetical protein